MRKVFFHPKKNDAMELGQKVPRYIFLLRMFLAILIVAITLSSLPNAYGVSANFADEIGYWGTAASWNEYDWSGVMSNQPYYSFIYAALLFPILSLPVSAVVMFRLAIVLNALLLVISYYIACFCAELLFPKTAKVFISVACAAVTLFSSNIFNAQNTGGETLYYLLYWLMFFSCLLFLRHVSVGTTIFFCVMAVLNFFAHMRNIGSLVAAVLTIVFTLVCQARSRTERRSAGKSGLAVIAAAVTLIVCIVGLGLLKENIVHSIYQANTSVSMNDIDSQTSKFASLLSLEGIWRFFNMCLGRLFYLGTGTYFLMYWAILVAVLVLICTYRKNKHIKNEGIFLLLERRLNLQYAPAFLFLLLSFFLSIGVSGLYFTDPGEHIVYVLYGRYTEQIVGAFLMIALIVIREAADKLKKYFLAICIFQVVLCTDLYFFLYANNINNSIPHPNVLAISGMYWFPGFNRQIQYTFGVTLEALIISALVFVLFLKFPKKSHLRLNSVIPVVLVIPWVACSFCYLYDYGNYTDEKVELQKSSIELAQVMTDLAQENVILYPYEGTPFSTGYFPISRIQYFAMDCKIDMVSMEEVKDNTDWSQIPYLLWSNKTNYPQQLVQQKTENYIEVGSTTELTFYVNKNIYEQIQDTIQAQEVHVQWSDMKYTESAELEKKGGQQSLLIQGSADNPEYALYGPGITLQSGSYRATITLECLNLESCQSDTLGQCDVSINGGRQLLSVFPLTKDIFEGGGQKTLALDFCGVAGQDLTQTEFRLFTTSNAQFRVTDVSYQYLGPQVKLLRPDTDDFNLMTNMVSLDSEFLPVFVVADEYEQEEIDVSDLESVLSGKGHQLSMISPDQVSGYAQGFLLVPTSENELVQSLLPSYTILARLQNYALLAPSSSDVCNKYRDNGGRALSDGRAIDLRYFAGAVNNAASSAQATVPAGNYRLEYEVQIPGASLFDSCGKLVISYDNQQNEIPLTKELFEYDVLRSSLEEDVILENNTKLSAQVTTIPEVSGAQMEIWLTPLS